jgi:hypothetical protein
MAIRLFLFVREEVSTKKQQSTVHTGAVTTKQRTTGAAPAKEEGVKKTKRRTKSVSSTREKGSLLHSLFLVPPNKDKC